jgi:hypothetical protein
MSSSPPPPPPKHPRTKIREYVCALLSGKTPAATRVHDTRVVALGGDMPTINVYTLDDRMEEEISHTPHEIRVVCPLVIEVSAFVNDTFAQDLDALCLQIESLIDFRLGGNAEKCIYASTTFGFDQEGDRVFAIAKITYNVYFQKTEGGLNTEFGIFDKFYGAWDMADPNIPGDDSGKDGQIDAIDQLEDIYTE